jgi:hypothetical protein
MINIRVGNVISPTTIQLADGTTIGQALASHGGQLNGGSELRLNGTPVTESMHSRVLLDGDNLLWARQTKGNIFARALRRLFRVA